MADAKIKKLRTFYEDFESAKPQPVAKSDLNETPIPTVLEDKEIEEIDIKKLLSQSVPAPTKPEPEKVTAAEPIVTKPAVVKPTPVPQMKPAHKEIDVSKLVTQDKPSLLNNTNSVFEATPADDNNWGEGSIITDTKRTHPSFIQSVVTSIKAWFAKIERARQVKRDQVPKVNAPEKRASVISTASTKSSSAPRDDFAHIAKRMEDTERSSEISELTIKKPEEITPVRWAELEEEPETVVASPEPNEEMPTPDTTTIGEAPEEIVPTIEIIGELEEALPESFTEQFPEETAPEVEVAVEAEPEPAPLPEEEIIEEEIPAVPITETPEEETEQNWPTEGAEEAEPATPPSRYEMYDRSRSAIIATRKSNTPWAIVLVSLFATLLGVGASVWWFAGTTDTVAPVIKERTGLLSGVKQTTAVLGEDRLSTYDSISQAGLQTAGTVEEIQLTINLQGATENVDTDFLLNTLSWRLPNDLGRTINAISFGHYGQDGVFAIIKASTFDIALSGMLSWETSMSSDLAPLFGEPVFKTFDPSGRSGEQIKPAYFIDTVTSNYDTRILHDENYDERLIYSFLDRNTILITNSLETFKALAPLLK